MRNFTVNVECPDCRKKVEIQIKRTFINSVKNCPHCGAVFEYTGNGARIIQKASSKAE